MDQDWAAAWLGITVFHIYDCEWSVSYCYAGHLYFVSLVKLCLKPIGGLDYGRQTNVCKHGGKHLYPKAELITTVNEQSYSLTVGEVENLPVDLILGC